MQVVDEVPAGASPIRPGEFYEPIGLNDARRLAGTDQWVVLHLLEYRNRRYVLGDEFCAFQIQAVPYEEPGMRFEFHCVDHTGKPVRNGWKGAANKFTGFY